ncbi:hypothetical protein F0231_13650 [Vibrio sp. RE86]|nr:hypothetical protein [Vibrio sp. RE86]
MLLQIHICSLYLSFMWPSTLLDVHMSLLMAINPAKITLSNSKHKYLQKVRNGRLEWRIH